MYYESTIVCRTVTCSKGTDGVRTRDLRFTRPTPYHLATAPALKPGPLCNKYNNYQCRGCLPIKVWFRSLTIVFFIAVRLAVFTRKIQRKLVDEVGLQNKCIAVIRPQGEAVIFNVWTTCVFLFLQYLVCSQKKHCHYHEGEKSLFTGFFLINMTWEKCIYLIKKQTSATNATFRP